jgi:hypothetical protein
MGTDEPLLSRAAVLSFLLFLVRQANANEPHGDGNSKSGNGDSKDDDTKNNDKGDKERGDFGGREHDPVETKHESSPDLKVETNDKHPLGDYGRALFDYGKGLADDMARSSPEAKDLKDLFDEAERARNLYESWNKATSSTDYLGLNQSAAGDEFKGSLVPDYVKVELLGMFLGLNPTSTTGGEHVAESAHYKAGAVDFSVRGLTMARVEQVNWMMRNAGAFARDERGQPMGGADGKTPQTPWSAPHIHVQAPMPKGRDLEKWSQPEFSPGTFMGYPGQSGPRRECPAQTPQPSTQQLPRP